MDIPTADPDRFAQRLNRLRQRFRPLQRDAAMTAKEVCDLVAQVTGTRISETHVKYLTSGQRQPSLKVADQLAKAFGVTAGYFTEPDWSPVVAGVEADLDRLELLRKMREANVTVMAARMKDLSTAELSVFADFISAELHRRGNQDTAT
ncbi:transcriptional regulator with XRE-family HTH domain [Hamadaea flava]|uniref:Helix-turn-helix domain-containing protein n=1 Tax=Hamadaea flava TaxID=1742688 RepID=A0ABV8LJK9_9ACTN|nr:helix-turn-helix transcriptional regulator [Hamadaea flava]MCP2323607.1 transcriptional regulator with XRE-family HTH domain [Hamadaea flava]